MHRPVREQEVGAAEVPAPEVEQVALFPDGARGVAQLPRLVPTGWPAGQLSEQGDLHAWVEVEFADPYRLELENMSAAIRGNGKPLLGRDDALAQARVLEALHRSAETGQAVAL